MPFTTEDRTFMQKAIDEAAFDTRIFKVGAVIVKDGTVLAKAHGGEVERQHAELTAIRRCLAEGKDLTGATIYSTLEPCTSDVRDPGDQPCAVEILNQPFRRVVIGVLDPNYQVRLRGVNRLQGPNLEVVLCNDNVLLRQIRTLSRQFFDRDWPRFRGSPGFALDENFQGRWQEREGLTQWLCRRGAQGAVPVLVLWAIGGMGKSNLTWLWAKHDVAGEELPIELQESKEVTKCCRVEKGWGSPLRIIWFNFYRHEGGRDFNAFLEEAIVHLSAGTKEPEDFRAGDRIDYAAMRRELVDILGTYRCLIVWDGAERLLNEYSSADPSLQEERSLDQIRERIGALRCGELEVSQFLWSAQAQTTSKLLISSRLPFQDLEGQPLVELKGLDVDAAVRMLRRRGVTGPQSLLEQAALEYEGHPLSLSNLAASLQDDFEFAGDIAGKRPINPGMPQDERRKHIFMLAFGRRAPHRRHLLSRISRVRGKIGKDVTKLLASDIPGLSAQSLGSDLNELVRHGLLRKSTDGEFYEFHPVTRRYIYDRPEYAGEKEEIHDRLREYYIPLAKSVDLSAVREVIQLAPVIEAYYHTARSAQYAQALAMFKPLVGRTLNEVLYYDLCEHTVFIGLLQELFPEGIDGEPAVPVPARGTVLNDLAHAHAKLGETERAVGLLERAIANHMRFAEDGRYALARDRALQEVGLGFEGLASRQIELGLLKDAHNSLKQAEKFYAKAHCRLEQAIVQQLFGELFGYMGQFQKSKRHIEVSINYARGHLGNEEEPDIHMVRGLCIDFGEFAFVQMLSSNAQKALEYAGKAAEMLAILQKKRLARDLAVKTQWIVGYAELLQGDYESAFDHLNWALRECRRLRVVQLEARILLAHAELSFRRVLRQPDGSQAGNVWDEAGNLAAEGLRIASRCKYRLQEAEIHNFLAGLWLARGNIGEARSHAESAVECASCGVGPSGPYYYKSAFELADKLLSRLSG